MESGSKAHPQASVEAMSTSKHLKTPLLRGSMFPKFPIRDKIYTQRFKNLIVQETKSLKRSSIDAAAYAEVRDFGPHLPVRALSVP